jgi:hypothetical protein
VISQPYLLSLKKEKYDKLQITGTVNSKKEVSERAAVTMSSAERL